MLAHAGAHAPAACLDQWLAMADCEQIALTNSAMAYSGRWRAMSASLTMPTVVVIDHRQPANLVLLHHIEHFFHARPRVHVIRVPAPVTSGDGVRVAARAMHLMQCHDR